jgi:hypothetical protein
MKADIGPHEQTCTGLDPKPAVYDENQRKITARLSQRVIEGNWVKLLETNTGSFHYLGLLQRMNPSQCT